MHRRLRLLFRVYSRNIVPLSHQQYKTHMTCLPWQQSSPNIIQAKPVSFQLQTSEASQKSIPIISYLINDKYMSLVKKMKELAFKRAQGIHINNKNRVSKEKQCDELYQQFLSVERQSQKYNYALLLLQRVVERQQLFTLKKQSQQCQVTVCGYNKTGKQLKINQHSANMIVTPNSGNYDRFFVQSGSPVFLSKQKDTVVGVHKGYNQNEKSNTCCIIDQQVAQNLLGWIKKLNMSIYFSQQLHKYLTSKFSSDNQNLVEEIKRLRLKNQELSNQLYRQKNMYEQREGKYLNTINQINSQKNHLTQRLQVQNARRIDFEKQLKQLNATIQRLNKQIAQLKKVPYKEPKVPPPPPPKKKSPPKYINDHSFNPHSYMFNVEVKQNKLSIKLKKFDYGLYYNFFKNGTIPSDAICTYKIKQVRTAKGFLMTGIATNSVLGLTRGYKNEECIVYESYGGGSLWKNREKIPQGEGVRDGEVISLEINTKNWQVKWSIGQRLLASTDIPEVMRKKQLFMVVLMVNQSDVVELALE